MRIWPNFDDIHPRSQLGAKDHGLTGMQITRAIDHAPTHDIAKDEVNLSRAAVQHHYVYLILCRIGENDKIIRVRLEFKRFCGKICLVLLLIGFHPMAQELVNQANAPIPILLRLGIAKAERFIGNFGQYHALNLIQIWGCVLVSERISAQGFYPLRKLLFVVVILKQTPEK